MMMMMTMMMMMMMMMIIKIIMNLDLAENTFGNMYHLHELFSFTPYEKSF